MLANEARRLGAKFRFGADVVSADCDGGRASVTLAGGERLTADVVVGADGLHGCVREFVLGYLKEPEGSGDLAYRVTIPREKLENDPDPFIRGIVKESVNATWCEFIFLAFVYVIWLPPLTPCMIDIGGPNRHVVLYGVRGDQMANLVLVSVECWLIARLGLI